MKIKFNFKPYIKLNEVAKPQLRLEPRFIGTQFTNYHGSVLEPR